MKRLFTLLIALVFAYSGFSQVPEKMSYQAVIRNSNDELVKSSPIGMQFSILQGSESGTPIYVETHSTSTNVNGLATVEIGGGTTVTGTFSDIDWSTGVYFLKTETDPTGGTSYSITGTSQILSVPYALHAKSAENITGEIDYTEVDPVFIASQASNITESDITNLSNLSGNNTGDQDLNSYATKNMGNENITNLADPVNDNDAVNKAYVDELKVQIGELQVLAGIAVRDIDGNIYKIVTIGTQVWMAENLKTTKYQNGDEIGSTNPSTLDIIGENEPKYQWAYNGEESNVETYGRLYTWHTISDSRKVCPAGWHIPNNNDWQTLITYVGGSLGTSIKLKEVGTLHWLTNNADATNEYGFTALPGGYRTAESFGALGAEAYWWRSDEVNSDYGSVYWIISRENNIGSQSSEKYSGVSVRCIKD